MDVRTNVVQTRGREGIVMPFRNNPASELVLDVVYEIFQHYNGKLWLRNQYFHYLKSDSSVMC